MRPRALPTIPNWMLTTIACLAEYRALRTREEPSPTFDQARVNNYHWYVRSDRAMQELGWQTRPLRQTIQDMFAWFAEQNLLSCRGINRWWMRPGTALPARV